MILIMRSLFVAFVFAIHLIDHTIHGEATPSSESSKWPPKLSFCGQNGGGWQSEFQLVSKGMPLNMAIFELERVDDSVEVLIAAVSWLQSPKSALEFVLPSLKCDFRKGGITDNSKQEPIAQTDVSMTVLATDGDWLTAKLRCPLPKFPSGRKNAIKFSRYEKMDTMNREKADSFWKDMLHYQLFVPSTQASDAKKNNWLVGPSIPICDSTHGVKSKVWEDRMINPTADEYEPRENQQIEEVHGYAGAALCVKPTDSSPMQDWSPDILREWFYYQRDIVGFSNIFIFDRFGEELFITKPELEVWYGKSYHIPHTSLYRDMAALMRGNNNVAITLYQERCEMLARQRTTAEYVLLVDDPMDLVVPMTRKKGYLPAIISSVMQDRCAERVRVKRVVWSVDDTNTIFANATNCNDNGICPHRSVVEYLADGVAVDEIKPLDFIRITPPWPWLFPSKCDTQVTIPTTKLQMVTQNLVSSEKVITHTDDSIKDGTFQWTISSVAAWVKQLTRVSSAMWFRRRATSSDIQWMYSPRNTRLPFRMCHSNRDNGPTWGQAIISRWEKKSWKDDVENDMLRLTIFNAEIVSHNTLNGKSTLMDSSDIGQTYLSFSAYSEEKDSYAYSQNGDSAWGFLFQSSDPLPEAYCIFNHPDPVERMYQDPKEHRTKAEFKILKDMLLWVICPIPEMLPAPNEQKLSTLVTFKYIWDKGASYQMRIRMIRPIQLCMGAEKETDWPQQQQQFTEYQRINAAPCDSKSIACRTACIDNPKDDLDPQAKCCDRCSNRQIDRSSAAKAALTPPSGTNDILYGRDISICLRPLFLETICVECDGMRPLSPERLVEWIEYHILIGIDVIYVLDQYRMALSPLLKGYIDSGRVILIPFPHLSDAGMSIRAKMKLIPSAADQMMASDYCMSIGRRRNDAYLALMDTDEFIRYPDHGAGGIRNTLNQVLRDDWKTTTSDNLPDSIIMERYDVMVRHTGLALAYRKRSVQPRRHHLGIHGKFFVRPDVMVHGVSLIHYALNASAVNDLDLKSNERKYKLGTNVLVANTTKLSIFHYREKDTRSWIQTPSTFDGETITDHNLHWAYDTIKENIMDTVGWEAANSLAKQKLLRFDSSFRKEKSIDELKDK